MPGPECKRLLHLPLSPSGAHSMLGNQELLGILSAPSKIFCLSSLATCAEYTCAEDSSGMGVGGWAVFFGSLYLSVNTLRMWIRHGT